MPKYKSLEEKWTQERHRLRNEELRIQARIRYLNNKISHSLIKQHYDVFLSQNDFPWCIKNLQFFGDTKFYPYIHFITVHDICVAWYPVKRKVKVYCSISKNTNQFVTNIVENRTGLLSYYDKDDVVVEFDEYDIDKPESIRRFYTIFSLDCCVHMIKFIDKFFNEIPDFPSDVRKKIVSFYGKSSSQ